MKKLDNWLKYGTRVLLLHIMRVGLKISNFQGWPISLPVSGIALTNNLTSSRTLDCLTVTELRRFP